MSINMYRKFSSAFVSSAVRRGDVLAAWCGIRPLVTDPNSKDTQSICRNHIVGISDSGLVTIAGQPGFACGFNKAVLEPHQGVNSVCVFRWEVDHVQVHG